MNTSENKGQQNEISIQQTVPETITKSLISRTETKWRTHSNNTIRLYVNGHRVMLSGFCNFVKINPKFYFHLSESQRSMWINIKHTHTIILSKGSTKNKQTKRTCRKQHCSGLPQCLTGKESAYHRRRRFDPSSGKIPYTREQLNLWATTIDSVL